MNKYYCYLLINEKNHSYIGITNNLEKRIKQHNGLLKNGAKATRKSKKWNYHLIIGEFTKSEACRFEYFWKYKTIGLKNRIKKLSDLLSSPEWLDKSIVQFLLK